jgi:hypothetical protein
MKHRHDTERKRRLLAKRQAKNERTEQRWKERREIIKNAVQGNDQG